MATAIRSGTMLAFCTMLSVLVIVVKSQSPAPCLYNSTHCACTQTAAPGKCLRTVSDGLCSVEQCNQAGMTCDCNGSNLCTIETCSHSTAANGSVASALQLGGTVPCVMGQNNIQCVRKMGEMPPETLPEEPREYRQLQFGPAAVQHMYNVTSFVDTDNVISPEWQTVTMHNKWPGYLRLRNRFAHIRVYENAERTETFLCAIYNGYNLPSDGLGTCRMLVEIEGLEGQTLSWRACDDPGECRGGPGTTLNGAHSFVDNLTDGWCVTPLERNGNSIRVTFTEATGLYGIEIQTPNSQFEYLWSDPPQHGMTGMIDSNGFSVDGSASFTINLNGIPVPN